MGTNAELAIVDCYQRVASSIGRGLANRAGGHVDFCDTKAFGAELLFLRHTSGERAFITVPSLIALSSKRALRLCELENHGSEYDTVVVASRMRESR